MCKASLVSMGFFYFDFSDDEKQTLRGLLSSLLVQLCAQSDAYCDILSRFYSAHRDGFQYPCGDALTKCLLDMLNSENSPRQAPVYIIVDALDECPEASGNASSRETVLLFLEELVGLNDPNLRICVTSHPEPDIETVLAPLAFCSLSLHNQVGQLQDIVNYVSSVVNSDQKMRRWNAEDKKLFTDTLSQRADGM